MNVEEFYNKSEYSKIDFGSNPTLFTKKELLDFANEYLEVITVTRCCIQSPTNSEMNAEINKEFNNWGRESCNIQSFGFGFKTGAMWSHNKNKKTCKKQKKVVV